MVARRGTATRKPRVVLTLGKFDGVHAGHRHLAATVIDVASRLDCAGAALVLHPHPASVLAGLQIPLLTSIQERRRRLLTVGLDIVEPLHFTPEVASLSPEAFVDRLCQRFKIAKLIIGPDFAFGKDRSGDLATLQKIGTGRGFEVASVLPLSSEGEQLSSKLVRRMVEEGSVEAARSAMREAVMLQGTVVYGAARGRELGFPTANLDLGENYCVPGNGIYAVQATWDGLGSNERDPGSNPNSRQEQWIDGVASIGVRPTFDNGPRSVEVFLLDFSGDLYGKTLKVRFIARQRGEEKFDRIEDLVTQMHRDVEISRRILAAENAPSWQVVQGASGAIAHVRGFDRAALYENVLESVPALRRGYGVAGLGKLPSSKRAPSSSRLAHLRLEGATQNEAKDVLRDLLDGLPSTLVGGSVHFATSTSVYGLLRRSDGGEAVSQADNNEFGPSIELIEGPVEDALGGLRVSLKPKA